MTSNGKITLYQCKNSEFGMIKKFYLMDDDIYNTFGGERIDRLLTAAAGFIIKKGSIDIGFILLMEEAENVFSIDAGILKDYRNKGYAIQALNLLKETLRDYVCELHVETKKDNIGANKSLQASGFILKKQIDNINYYIEERSNQKVKH
jgi:ribosomal protein S18 acetylase RimI-like enzyme